MDNRTLTFAEDQLNRQQIAKNLTTVIEHWSGIKPECESLVLALDAKWGAGKSFFVNMWKSMLISMGDKYTVSYYNAWENDDLENPLIPLMYNLQKDLIDKIESDDEKNKKKTEFMKAFGLALVKGAITKVGGEDFYSILKGATNEAIDSAIDVEVKSIFSQYENLQKQKNTFREVLQGVIPENGKLIIFVDELDRCRPTFAIETLEIVKHFFNIKNIVFVFSVDLTQLAYSISTMYGIGMDAQGYLRRFFDLNVNLPSPNIKQYLNSIITYFNENGSVNFQGKVVDMMNEMYTKLHLSLRDIDKISNSILVFYTYYGGLFEEFSSDEERVNVLEVYLYFMILKYKYPEVYALCIKESYIQYDNAPRNWPVLDMKFCINKRINIILNKMQTEKNKDIESDLREKITILPINYLNISFADHIDKTLELFS